MHTSWCHRWVPRAERGEGQGVSGREEFDSEAPSNDWADLAAIASADTHQAREVLLAAFLADRESVIQAVARRCARRIAGSSR